MFRWEVGGVLRRYIGEARSEEFREGLRKFWGDFRAELRRFRGRHTDCLLQTFTAANPLRLGMSEDV